MTDHQKELRAEIASYERLSDQKSSEKYKKEAFDAAFDATQVFAKALNGGPSRAVVLGILSALDREHRYLQQKQIMAMLMALGLVDVVGGSDARNEFAHGLTAKVRETLDDSLFYNVPKGA
jgi:hypothetical protein